MDSRGGSCKARRQQRLANKFGLLVVIFMLFSAVFATVGNVSPVAAAQPECPDGEVLNGETGECEFEVVAAQPDCAEDEVMNPLTGLCEPPPDAAQPDCAEDEVLNEETGECDPIVEPPQPECAEDEMLNEETGECEPAVAPTEVTDGDMDDATDGDVVTMDEPVGMVDIYKYECPSGFSGENSSSDDFASLCLEPMLNVGFAVYDLDEAVGGGTTDGDGYVGFSGLAAETHSVSEDVPIGYGIPYVFCASGDDPSSLGGFGSYEVIYGYYVTIDFADINYYACSWYNIPRDDGGIDIYKWHCPPGYDSTDILYDALLVDCTQSQDNVEFSLGNGTDSYDSGTTGEDGPGRITFENYQPGTVVITETIPEGYGTPAVLCSSRIYVEAPEGDFQTSDQPTEIMDVTADGSIVTEVGEDWNYICYWFNFPGEYDIIIYKYVCPAGYAPAAFGYGELTADCAAETLDGVVFHLGDQDQATGEVIPGGVAFAGYEPGEIVIREEVPAGYTPYVFCGQSSGGVAWNQITPVPMLLILAEDGSITVNLPENSRLICYWYNFPTGDATTDGDVVPQDEPTGSIDIFKLECPSGLRGENINLRYFQDPPPVVDRFTSVCTEPMGGIAFEATADQGIIVGGGATEPGGYLNIRELPLNQVAIVESIPAGYGAPRVFCFDDSAGEYLELAVTGFTITVDFSASNYYSCYWFNFPAETSVPDTILDLVDEPAIDEAEEPGYIAGLTLQHYLCDPGFDPRLNQGNFALLQLCTGAGKPAFVYNIYVDQTLVESVGLQTSAGAWGEVFLPAAQQEPIPSGLLTIQVDPPAGYLGARVNCLISRTDDSSEEFEPTVINGTSIMVQVGAGESLVCEWFNMPTPSDMIPTPDPGYAQIKIAKFVCASAFDPNLEPAASAYLRACREVGPGQEFTIQRGTDDATTEVADGTGELHVFGLPPAGVFAPTTYIVAEQIPAGFAEPVVMCGETGMAKTRATVIDGNTVTIEITAPGMSIECDWINIPND